eukprot:scaffold42615_cov42-Phaeocystis_antarctica.AAC.2
MVDGSSRSRLTRLSASRVRGPDGGAVCVVSRTLAGGSSPPPAPQLICIRLGRGRRGRVEGAGRQPELGLALKLPPQSTHFHRWKLGTAVKIGFLD